MITCCIYDFRYIYKRLKFLGNRVCSQFLALLFLAAWHGHHFGYYVCFFMEFIIMIFEKDVSHFFPFAFSPSFYKTTILKLILLGWNTDGQEWDCQLLADWCQTSSTSVADRQSLRFYLHGILPGTFRPVQPLLDHLWFALLYGLRVFPWMDLHQACRHASADSPFIANSRASRSCPCRFYRWWARERRLTKM